MSYKDKLKTWITHIGGSFKEISPHITEYYVPDTDLVVHLNEEENKLYIHGFNGASQVETDELRIRTSGLDEGNPVDNKREITNPNFAMLTLDDRVGSIEIKESPRPYYQDTDMLKIGVSVQDDSESIVSISWSELSPEERGEVLDDLPDSHHKQILKRELKASGLEF